MIDPLKEFHPPKRLLMGPGPANVHQRVLEAMSAPILSHVDPIFHQVMDDVKEMLRLVFGTSNNLTIPLSGTGTAGMEAAFINMLEPGDHVVIAVNGFFGERMVDVATRCGAIVHPVRFKWGTAVGPDISGIEDEIKRYSNVKAIGVVHAETSTGVLSPLPDLASLAHNYGAVIIVDAVTSLGGGEELQVDDWGLDICYGGTQKCLGAPPGMAPITIGPRAIKILEDRNTPVQSFYLNLVGLEAYWGKAGRTYHHTAPISMVYGVREALRMVLEEGLPARVQRHAKNAAALRAGLGALGLAMFADADYSLNPLTSVCVPGQVDDKQVRKSLLDDYDIEIGGGLGETNGKIWRIGLMGATSSEATVFSLLSGLERVLSNQGHTVPVGTGLQAAQKALLG